MWFWRRKREAKDAETEAQIQAIRKDTYKKVAEARDKLRSVNELLDDDIAYRIYVATGGEGRQKSARR